MSVDSPQIGSRLKGGSDSWDDGPAGAILLADYFTAPSCGGNVKVWDGVDWLIKPVKVWDGADWVVKPAKVWNGSAWVATNY